MSAVVLISAFKNKSKPVWPSSEVASVNAVLVSLWYRKFMLRAVHTLSYSAMHVCIVPHQTWGNSNSKDHSVIVIVIDLLTNDSNRKTHDLICVVTANNMRPQLLKTIHFQHNWPLVPPLSAGTFSIRENFMSEHCRLTDN